MKNNLLQRIDLDVASEVSGLYWAALRPATDGQPPTTSPEGLRAYAGSLQGFDTYFNAFFENHWFGHTSLQSVNLRVSLKGDATVTMYRQTPERDRYRIAQERVEGASTVTMRVDDDNELRVEAGRIWFEIEAHSDIQIESADWWTEDEPARDVALAVVFCTFNREKYLQRILRTIDEDDRAVESVARVLVVNQGTPFTANEIVGEGNTGRLLEKLTLIEQPNMGGCGGFTRGMYESVQDPDITHFLLMDDDSRVNAESIARTVAFLAYADENVVVGGHMLNLHRPNRLFEAGATLDPSNLQPHAIHHNTDLLAPDGLEPFLRTNAVSYNGWWMFGAATDVVESIGYPMPCFIRGDDMEFGLRVKNSGRQTIAVPGVAVWHEPFYLKMGGWQFFFEVRNRLAKASMHRHSDFEGIKKDFRKVFARDIAMCRYHSSKLMIEAIKAYAAGPEVALDTTNGPLLAARAWVDEFGPATVEGVSYAPSKRESLERRGELRRLLDTGQQAVQRRIGKVLLAGQIARRVVLPGQTNAQPPLVRSVDLKPHVVAGYDTYIVVEEHGGEAWQFQRNRELERELWREFLQVSKSVVFDQRYLDRFDDTDRFEKIWQEIFADLDTQHAKPTA